MDVAVRSKDWPVQQHPKMMKRICVFVTVQTLLCLYDFICEPANREKQKRSKMLFSFFFFFLLCNITRGTISSLSPPAESVFGTRLRFIILKISLLGVLAAAPPRTDLQDPRGEIGRRRDGRVVFPHGCMLEIELRVHNKD